MAFLNCPGLELFETPLFYSRSLLSEMVAYTEVSQILNVKCCFLTIVLFKGSVKVFQNESWPSCVLCLFQVDSSRY